MCPNTNSIDMDEIKIRQYKNGDEKQIVKLLKQVFHQWPKFDINCSTLDHWTWKYIENPLQRNFITVAIYNDEIIGVAHSIYLKVKVGSNIYIHRSGYDVAIHPSFQGMGVYSKITEYRKKQPDYDDRSLSTSVLSNPVMIKRTIKHGSLEFPYGLQTLIKIKNLNKFTNNRQEINKHLIKPLVQCLIFINKIRALGRNVSINDDVVIKKIDVFDNEITQFWKEELVNYNYIVVKSQEYMNWRYCDLRGGKYIKYEAIENNRLIGYIVIRVNNINNDYKIGYIVDLLVKKDRKDVTYKLLYASMQYFENEKTNEILYWVIKNHTYAKIISLLGFINSYHDPRLFISAKDRLFIKESDYHLFKNSSPDSIIYQYGDLDII